MSTILLTDHNENIYNIIKQPPSKPAPRVVTKSNYVKELLAKEKQKLKKFPHKTMGYAEVPIAKPTEFLKKHQGIPRPKIVVDQCHPCSKTRSSSKRKFKESPASKPEVKKDSQVTDTGGDHLKQIEYKPRATSADDGKKVPHLVLGKKSRSHNFLRRNYIFVKKLKPQEPKHYYADTNKGATHALKPSGLELNYSLSKTFGKLPKYLTLQKEQQQKLEKELKAEVHREKPEGRYITQPERQALLEGLKHNWAELQKQYLLLPIIIDTVPKKNRKLKLEKELKDLEKDIKTIEEHPYIFVSDAEVPEFNYEPEEEEE